MVDWAKAIGNSKAALAGQVMRPTDPKFSEATKIWSRSTASPLAVVRCRDVKDVQDAIRLASTHHLPLSVKGGGHDWACRALCDGVVVDLSDMRGIEASGDHRTARIGGGTLACDLVARTDQLGVAAVTGTVGAVGLGGLVLGGGYGPLIAKYGLACDNLIEAEVVLADGRVMTANESENFELLWALKGGGGGFGVVTAMTLRLHTVSLPLCGTIIYGLSDGPAVIACARDLSATAPDNFTLQLALMANGEGENVIAAVPTWIGGSDGADEWIEPLLKAAPPIHSDISRRSFSEALSLFDGPMLNTRDVRIETCWVSELTSDVGQVLIQRMANRPGLGCSIITHEFRGAACRISPNASAFGMRGPHTLIDIVVQSDAAESLAHECWARETLAELLPYALPGGYANLLDRDDPRGAQAYGPNLSRLVSMKMKFDPTNRFSSGLSLPGAPAPLVR